jgi:hypothetical protein
MPRDKPSVRPGRWLQLLLLLLLLLPLLLLLLLLLPLTLQLQHLDASGCETFTHAALVKIGMRCMFLQSIVLDNVEGVDDDVLAVRSERPDRR